MTVEFVLMLVLGLVILFVMSIGPVGISYLVTWLKSKRTQSPKTKTEHTVSDSQGS
jgi:hypothetical protein